MDFFTNNLCKPNVMHVCYAFFFIKLTVLILIKTLRSYFLLDNFFFLKMDSSGCRSEPIFFKFLKYSFPRFPGGTSYNQTVFFFSTVCISLDIFLGPEETGSLAYDESETAVAHCRKRDKLFENKILEKP